VHDARVFELDARSALGAGDTVRRDFAPDEDERALENDLEGGIALTECLCEPRHVVLRTAEGRSTVRIREGGVERVDLPATEFAVVFQDLNAGHPDIVAEISREVT
jgi:hypothetical protein